ncbi:hypothetical protein CMT41_02035 [Colwellia sp. MT41]|nr:hypothetical protein CMT41_02035 [Colwellia sp. MT41]
MMTNPHLSKFMQLIFACTLTLATLVSFSQYSDKQTAQIQQPSLCMTVASNLPMNHVNHPCQASNMSNKSWLSWLSGDSKSTHLHFLDLVELIHYSFH